MINRDDPRAPRYWRYEISGLQPAIERYLNSPSLLTVGDIALIRAYLIQWINSPVWDMNPESDAGAAAELAAMRAAAREIRTIAGIHEWLWKALEIGIDPL